jgi:hypothetical protein
VISTWSFAKQPGKRLVIPLNSSTFGMGSSLKIDQQN